jgi:tRNA A-37 threonylcarbamoyl transferase component Bud32/tetratricopeptide (TPR) repeat protein
MNDLRARLERALGAGYSIERELGGGGMSRTYLAIEAALRRQVVIKVLAPELRVGISVERFRREVLVAAKLQHPHVVPVLTTGEVEDLPWFTMPYVEGDSLRHRLEEGPVAISEAVSILRDVARALAYAHSHGIVHRDIKPDNVLLSAGSATVTDFGIAKAISVARTADGHTHVSLTQTGTSIGTPTYMAPEQGVGDPNTDHRADIYAFGAMAYEILAGQPPFTATNPARMLAAHIGETPKDLRTVRPDTPPALAELVMHCLAKDPADRPQQATDLVRVLETVTTSGSAAAVPAILHGGRIRLGRALALWAGASALVILTAWAATEVIGLPDWALPGAIGVMLAGLPIILITAYVQRTTHRVFTATPQRTPGGSPTPHGTLATLAVKVSPHVSWRRTWLGGAIAVGAFAALVVGFMVLRALGIGPMGSLRGSGAFGERETIVVADFRGPPADSALGPTVAEALRTDLAQSTSLGVLTRANVREILALMQRPRESAVPFELAREIATREGAKAVLDGAIVQLGSSYVLSARLVSALDGNELATFRQTADDEDALIKAVSRLSRDVRGKAGESLRAIRATSGLERVTTASLPALRKYVEGVRIADEEGDTQRGLTLLQEAVELDSGFAMAWRKLAVLLRNEGRDRPRALAAISAAYRHRARLTEMERLLTEAYYFQYGPAVDIDKALAAYEEVIRLDSTSPAGLNNAAILYDRRRDFQRSEELYRRATRLPRTFGGAFMNLMIAQLRNARPVAAIESTAAAFRARFPNSADLWEGDWYAAWARSDLARADSVALAVRATGRTPRTQIRSALALVATHERRGQILEAARWLTLADETIARVEPSPVNRFRFGMDSALVLAEYTPYRARASAILARLRARIPLAQMPAAERPYVTLAELAALLQAPALAREAAEGWKREQQDQVDDSVGTRASLEAYIALAEGRWRDAIDRLREADARFAVSERYTEVTLARAFDAAGEPDSALAHFETLIRMPEGNPRSEPSWLAMVSRRLGELYEAKGDLAKAAEHYARFIELWEKADPELQPTVREARARLAAIRAKTG